MTAKMSNRGDNMTEVNLQAEGLREEPAQRAVDGQEMEEGDSSPHNSPMWSLYKGCLQAVSIRTIVYRYK